MARDFAEFSGIMGATYGTATHVEGGWDVFLQYLYERQQQYPQDHYWHIVTKRITLGLS